MCDVLVLAVVHGQIELNFCAQSSTQQTVPFDVSLPYKNDVAAGTADSPASFNCTCTISLPNTDKTLRTGLEIDVGPTRLKTKCLDINSAETENCGDGVYISYFQSDREIGPDKIGFNEDEDFSDGVTSMDKVKLVLVNNHQFVTTDPDLPLTVDDNHIRLNIERTNGDGKIFKDGL